MADAAAPTPFEGPGEMRDENARLLEEMDLRLGQDTRPESETAVLRELEPRIRDFLARGTATGAFVENIRERTACQVLLDYWSSTLSHAGIDAARPRLDPFDAARLPDLKDRQCPFVGLEAFRDPGFFFGREKAVDSLLQRVAEAPLVVVQGASGSGKSSLVMGGALPRLAAPDHVPPYRILGPFTPGSAPLEALAGAVGAVASGSHRDVGTDAAALRRDPASLVRMLEEGGAAATLLVVDQFEELFTLAPESERTALVACLDALLRSRPDNRVVLTLREEFSSELERIDALRPHLSGHPRFSMRDWPMGYDELKAAVERPASLVNLQFAPGIVDAMVKSVLGRDTALPLLQFTLRRLWALRDRNRVTHAVYQQIGGNPLVALERYADGFYDGLLREQKDEVERILSELTRIDRMLEPYREPRLQSELLAGGNPRTAEMLALLEREDFVRITPTADGRDAAVEVKHEALLRNWPRYRDWINGKRERVRQRIALTEAAQRWSEGGCSPTEGLLSAWQLQAFEHVPDLSPVEADYLRVSAEALDRERMAREQALRRAEQRKWVARLAGLAALVVAGGLAWFWTWQRQDDRRSMLREMVDLQVEMAQVREATARGHVDHALQDSLRVVTGMRGLAGDGDKAGLRAQVRDLLISTLRGTDDVRRLFVVDDGAFHSVAFEPNQEDAVLAYAGSDHRVYVSGLDTDVGRSLDACSPRSVATAVAFDATGRWLVSGCSDGTISFWSSLDWTRLGSGNLQVFDPKVKVWTIAASPAGRVLAVGGTDNRVMLVPLGPDGAPSGQPPQPAGGDTPRGHVWSLAFSPSGDALLVGDGVGTVLHCSVGAGDPVTCRRSEEYPGDAGGSRQDRTSADAIRAFSFAPDGSQVAVGHWNGSVELWTPGAGPEAKAPINLSSAIGPVTSLLLFEACGARRLAIGKGLELLYTVVGPASTAPASTTTCVFRPRASVGDEISGLAFHAPSGSIAAATRGGYVAVLEPTDRADPLRTTIDTRPLNQGERLRGAVVAETKSESWLLVPTIPAAEDGSNLAVFHLRDGAVERGGPVQLLKAGAGIVHRLHARREHSLVATLGCSLGADRRECDAAQPQHIAVWNFTPGPPSRLDLVREVGLDRIPGLVPSRIALSPDGRHLVVSFECRAHPDDGAGPEELQAWTKANEKAGELLLVELQGDADARWIPSGMPRVREIAFSPEGSIFGAGGAAAQAPDGDAGTDEVRLWDVTKSGLQARKQVLAVSRRANKVYELAFAMDSRRKELVVLAGGESGVIDRWVVRTGRRPPALAANSKSVQHIAFSVEAALLAAADSQGVLYLWSTSSWTALQLTPQTDAREHPGFLDFAGDGRWLASGAGSLRLWTLDFDSLRARVCALLRSPGQPGTDGPGASRSDDACAAPGSGPGSTSNER
jgi:WD40 repeat protein